jgi:hypothetical protein
MHRLVWKGRKVAILFDTNVRDKSDVQAARSRLTAELQKMSAVVSWFAWPDDTPVGVNGIDDHWERPKLPQHTFRFGLCHFQPGFGFR